jgi:hypothetical protein
MSAAAGGLDPPEWVNPETFSTMARMTLRMHKALLELAQVEEEK